MLARISSWVRAGGSVPTIVQTSVPEDFQKRLVFYRSQQPPGVIVVDTLEHSGFDAFDPLRGIGVGREGFTGQGLLQISRKAEWPDWHPPPEMIERQPYLPRVHGRWAARRARDVSWERCTASTAPTPRKRQAKRSRPAASGSSTTT